MLQEQERPLSTTDALDERAYPIPQACELLGGISRRKLYTEVQHGRLEARKIGSRTVILASEIQRYLAALPAYDES
jgi:excisionase family DNA binding protein